VQVEVTVSFAAWVWEASEVYLFILLTIVHPTLIAAEDKRHREMCFL